MKMKSRQLSRIATATLGAMIFSPTVSPAVELRFSASAIRVSSCLSDMVERS